MTPPKPQPHAPPNTAPEPHSPLALPRRPRRLRASPALRDLVAETRLAPSDLIAPFFVIAGSGAEEPIGALPGVSRLSVDRLLRQLERGLELGVRAAVLFGVLGAADKDPRGVRAADPQGPVARALREARRAFGSDLVLITDVCLCGYTDHGHCGLLKATPRGVVIDNDSSLAALAEMAVTHAEAGADLVSPSDMMDGRVGYLRGALDRAGFTGVGILAYTVKYASAFYGPFREAAGSAPQGGTSPDGMLPPRDRRTYQMDPRNAREGLVETALDEAEGADMLMVKPALAYLDVLWRMRAATPLPLAAYHVSGEYAALKAAARAGALDEASAVQESLWAIKRAGADLIITYYALEAAAKGWLG
ncbi:porphobilinogen synthase [Truepera radiovictrix]|uniref:Delta-aminolevulinic acid dehydratase n=1 Tax=Truepera radiovictrix (strain DSM 17093 / CIP 108686 / LMG 22925 / RQ-24) TaxID=649638 RepID=D7CY05_TRURR|nr:porphobilinogen synthase [Truepera radiovictrix]ADI13365.1 Porphobilinogen synthase [Truepera radiovictrix DSM 17093]WMT58072.1 porphobilinogen synthase [Truepera radiovictrix]